VIFGAFCQDMASLDLGAKDAAAPSILEEVAILEKLALRRFGPSLPAQTIVA